MRNPPPSRRDDAQRHRDRILTQFRTAGTSLIPTNLSGEQSARLREAFADTE